MFGLNMQVFIGFIFPLKVRWITGSENIVWGKISFLIFKVFLNFDILKFN